MYDELVKRLREADEKSMCGECGLNLRTGAAKKGVLFAEAADAIEELSAIREEQKAQIILMAAEIEEQQPLWIPVTERLPEGVVLAVNKFGLLMIGLVFTDGHDYRVENGLDCLCYVTHWMPLPEPPKEG